MCIRTIETVLPELIQPTVSCRQLKVMLTYDVTECTGSTHLLSPDGSKWRLRPPPPLNPKRLYVQPPVTLTCLPGHIHGPTAFTHSRLQNTRLRLV